MRRDFVLMVFAMEMLVACGQTGPLYLPEEPPPVAQETETAVTTEADGTDRRTDAVANEAVEGDRTDVGDKGVELKEKGQ